MSGFFTAIALILSLQGATAEQGWTLLNAGKVSDAAGVFERAAAASPKASGPQVGLAVAQAGLGKTKESEATLKKAESLAKTPAEKLELHANAIRVYTLAKPSKDWLNKAKDHLDAGLRIDNLHYPALQYRMAQAYIQANNLTKAQDLLAQVVAIKGDYAAEGDREWKRVQKVLRASPATRMGAGIAMQDRISRADLCALLVDEMGLDKMFAPGNPVADPADLQNHPQRQEIVAVLQRRIRGLETREDGSFAPNAPVSRAELAFILEDVVIKITKDPGLATRYLGADRSPFPDVPPTHALFNAVMTVTSRGIVEADLDGRYRPSDPAEGADVLVSLRRLATAK